MLKTKYLTGLFMVIPVIFSCTRDKTYDIKGETDVKFFTNNTPLGNAPENSINYSVVNIPDAAGSGMLNLSTTLPAIVKFPVFATKPVGENVIIGAMLDNSLIAKYNASHNTEYLPFPAGILNTDNLAASIMKGMTTSVDSFTIGTNMAGLNTLTEKAYMAPIKLTTVSNPVAGQITNNVTTQVTYIVVNMELRRIKYLGTTADVAGPLVSPRTSWTATFTPALTTTGNIFDGSTASYSRWGADIMGQLDVDMQSSRNVSGIRLYHGSSSNFTPAQIEVFLSNDGINYDLIGSPLRANLTYASNYNYIIFYKPIPAQYVRLKLTYSTSTNTQNRRIAEFDVYAN